MTVEPAAFSSALGPDESDAAWIGDDFLSGRLLIAAPGIDDPRFERAVILMCGHSADEAMGIAVNQPVAGLVLPELLAKLGVKSQIHIPAQAVLLGGPVECGRGFVLHTDDFVSGDATTPVAHGVALTATRDVLDAMGDAVRRPRQSVLALGYAGWEGGQLEQELKDNAWLIGLADEALIFDDDHETKWARALAKLGVAPDRLSSLSGRA